MDVSEIEHNVLSCPFCGEKPIIVEWRDEIIRRASVRCDACKCGFHDIAYAHAPSLLGGLVEKWNTRHSQSFEIIVPADEGRWRTEEE